jgi:hypothetical protein
MNGERDGSAGAASRVLERGWYEHLFGEKPLSIGCRAGRLLGEGEMEGYPGTLKRLPPAVEVETYTIGGPGGRTMSAKDGAGLYSNSCGDLMWAWGTGEWNHYELWRFQ